MKTLTFIALLLISFDAQSDIKKLITVHAKKSGVNPKLAVAIAMTESNLDHSVVGGLGEIGLFQLRPEFHGTKQELKDLNTNIRKAMRYLKYVESKCRPKYGNYYYICFNTGPYRTYTVQKPKEFPYVQAVQKNLKKLEEKEILYAGVKSDP